MWVGVVCAYGPRRCVSGGRQLAHYVVVARRVSDNIFRVRRYGCIHVCVGPDDRHRSRLLRDGASRGPKTRTDVNPLMFTRSSILVSRLASGTSQVQDIDETAQRTGRRVSSHVPSTWLASFSSPTDKPQPETSASVAPAARTSKAASADSRVSRRGRPTLTLVLLLGRDVNVSRHHIRDGSR